MRALTVPESAALQSRHRTSSMRVLIEDATATLRDVSALSGRNWIHGVEWGAGIDDATASATVGLRREIYGTSLSTLADDSPLNADGPLVDVGREISIDTATGESGSAPGLPIWRRVFTGEVDDSDLASGTAVSLACRDRGGVLLDTQIETEREYGSGDGVALHLVMQQLLDDTLGAGVVTLVVPLAPTFLVTTYIQSPGSLLEALQGLAALIGWTVRYDRWSEADGAYALTLYEPDRAKEVVDWTVSRSNYLTVNRLRVARDRIRNVIRLEYTDAVTQEPAFVHVEDAASIAKYGRRFMRLVETASPIDTEVEALAMANAALLDLADPIAELEVELLYFWPVELGDLVTFEAKPGCFDRDQTLAVVGYRHSIVDGKRRTMLTMRGRPAGAYSAWLRREVALAGENATEPEDPKKYDFLAAFAKDEDADGVTVGLIAGDAVSVGWVYDIAYQLPIDSPPRPSATMKPTSRIYRLEDGSFEYRAARPSPGWKKLVYFVPRAASLRNGEVKVVEVLPAQLPSEGIEDGAITTPKVAALAITEAELAEAAVVRTKILDGAVDDLKLAAEAVTEAKVAIAAISAAKLQDLAVTAQKIADAAVSTVKIALGAIDTSRLADAAVVGVKIAAAALTIGHFAAGIEPVSVVAAVPGAKSTSAIVSSTDGKLYRWNGSAYTAAVPATDLTGQITSSQITDSAITTPKLMAGSVTTAVLAAGSVTANELAANSVVAGKVSAGAISTAELAAGAVNASKIAAGSITSSEIAANTITASNIAALSITGDRVAANTLVGAKLVAGTITSSEIASATIVAGNIASATITSGQIAASTITGANIAALTIQAGNLATDSVNASKIVAASITGDRLAALTITGDKISANAITADKISVSSLSALSANLGTVTAGTISAGVIFAGQLSAATGTFAGDLRLDSSTVNKLSFRSAGTEYGYISAEVVSSAGVVSIYFSDSAVTPALRLLQGTGQFDRTLTVSGKVSAEGLQLGAGNLGFFAAAPAAKKTVTGSRGGNAALASLLTQLSDYGLITNSTSA